MTSTNRHPPPEGTPPGTPGPAVGGLGPGLPRGGGPAHKTPLGFGHLEQAVISVLWDARAGAWLTVGQVAALMSEPRGRTTVQATLAALWRKGHAERGRASGPRGSWRYRAACTREDYLTRRVLAVLAYSPDPEGTLTRVIAQVTAP